MGVVSGTLTRMPRAVFGLSGDSESDKIATGMRELGYDEALMLVGVMKGMSVTAAHELVKDGRAFFQ